MGLSSAAHLSRAHARRALIVRSADSSSCSRTDERAFNAPASPWLDFGWAAYGRYAGTSRDAVGVVPAGVCPCVLPDAGIPVVLCANGIEGSDFTSRVDVDFWEVAYKSGDGLAQLMGGKGKIVIFNGIAGVDSTETWVAAAKAAFAKYPEIEIIAEEYAQWNIATAKQKMEAIMAANPQIDGVWAGGLLNSTGRTKKPRNRSSKGSMRVMFAMMGLLRAQPP